MTLDEKPTILSLERAETMIAAGFRKGGELGLKPLSIAVLDAGGHLLAFGRQDGSSIMRPQIAIAKASGALGLGVSSRTIGEMAGERPSFIAALHRLSPQGLLPAAGGLLVADSEGRLLGAIGVTGDTSDNDELCALAGVAEAGFTTPG
ncbi:GlcG/HbpS family heme-binding protein [Parasphingopyxis marina]|uniref:Heme-binding protein n=1 Tax=Parasphingopyxis marina TaxID=2761622 RepID=A0A842HS54_9SPHN|nr:heme-binding protein [Parasphingopyxis marina]MBC2776668.1 heme-binding protein [Parasphingopyxis marina]